MRVSFQHANPHRGNESFVLRFHESGRPRTPCLLVDAGDGVDLDGLLSDDDYLVAVLLTHLHMDHYRSLGQIHRDQAPVVVSPSTAAIFETVLSEANRQHDLAGPASLAGVLEPADGWVDVIDTVRVHPVPAGHAPGATGFVIRFDDGDGTGDILATGDFTCRRAAGFAGFDPSTYSNVGAVFLTASTNEDQEAVVTELLGTTLERAHAGSTTLLTTGALTGVHLAYLLTAAADYLDFSVPIELAGQAAKLYEDLDYDLAAVTSTPEFARPSAHLNDGGITIAGPAVPEEGSAARFYECIRDDPEATLIQVTTGGERPLDSGGCTTYAFEFRNHPTQETLDDVVTSISPTQIVIEHQRGRAADQYKDQWNSYVWATDDDEEHVIYDDGQWSPPPWVTDAMHRRVRGRERLHTEYLDGDLPLPGLERHRDADLVAEGVDTDRLSNVVSGGDGTTATDREQRTKYAVTASADEQPQEPSDTEPNVTPTRSDGLDSEGDASTSDQKPTMTSDDSNAADEPVQDDEDDRLYDTLRKPTDGSDSAVAAEFDFDPEDIPDSVRAQTTTQKRSGEDLDEKSEGEETAQTDTPSDKVSDPDDSTRQEQDEGSGGEPEPEAPNEDATSTENGSAEGEEPASNNTESGKAIDGDESSAAALTVDVDPAVVELVDRTVAADADHDSRDEFVRAAVESFIEGSLRGERPWEDVPLVDERRVRIDADPALAKLIDETATTEGVDRERWLQQSICERLDVTTESSAVSAPGFEGLPRMLDAIVENEECPITSRDRIVQASLEAALGM